MKIVVSNEHVIVADQFLPERGWLAACQDAARESYSFINAITWDKVYEIGDGRPLEGPAYVATRGMSERTGLPYPSGSGFDALARAVIRRGPMLAPWLRRFDPRRSLLTVRAQLFPTGSMLTWHNDQRMRLGTFAYYAHRSWNERWGGELVVLAGSAGRFDMPKSLGIGISIPPKPNRLVLLRAGVNHMIKRVEPSAGDGVRVAIAGSFVASGRQLEQYRRG